MSEKITTKIVLNILSLEDSVHDFEIIREQLNNAGYTLSISRVEKESEFISLLRSNPYDIILADFKLPGFDAFGALQLRNEICPDVPFICVSGAIGEERAIQLLKSGANDYVIKDRLERLPFAIKNAMIEAEEKENRRIAEDQLRLSEERFRAIWDESFDGMRLMDKNGTIVMVNNAFCNQFGKTRDELEDHLLDVLYASGDGKRILATTIEGFRNKTFSPHFEMQLTLWNDRTVWFEISNSIIEVGTRQQFLLSIFRDITDRKRSEEIARKSVEKHRDILQTAIDGFWLTDKAGCLLEVNENYCQMSGYSKEELLTMRISDLESVETVGTTIAHIQSIIIKGEDRFESRHHRKDGTVFDVEVSVQFRNIEEGQFVAFLKDITERKRVENALRESEEIFRQLMEHSPIYVFFKDENIRATRLSKNFETMLGRPIDELLGKNMNDLFPSDLAKSMVEDDKRILQGGMRVDVEEELNGRYYFTTKFPIDVEGKPRYLAGFTIDITDRKKAEKKLKEIITKNPMSIQILDKDGCTLDVNNSFKSLFGSVPPPGYSIFNDIQFAQQGLSEIFEKLRTGQIVRFPDVCFNPNDSIPGLKDVAVWTRTIGFPLNDSNDKPEQYVLMHENITDWKQAEEALRESEEKFAKVFRDAPVLIAITDLNNGIYLDVNEQALQVSGFTREEVIGHTAVELGWITSEDRARLVKEVKHNGVISGLEMEFHAKEGKSINGLVNGEPIVIGGQPCLLTVTIDITERKNSEQALRNAQKLESIGTLAGGIAHDFNNLMNAVLGQSALALNKLPKESPAVNHITKAIKASERVADLTRQLLAYSGRGKFLVDEIDLNNLVKENVQILEVSIPKTTRLRYELGSPSPHIMGDISQIQQVIMNLIINAGEAMVPNPGQITLRTNRIELTENNTEYSKYSNAPLVAGSYALLQVSDTGSGISQETLARIFDPFFTTKFTGRGLGLAAVLGIIKGHKGGLRIESEVGKGTMFEIVFPLVSTSSVTKAVEKKESSVVKGGEERTILVIDDESSVIELLEDLLSAVHFKVIGASDPLEGIERYRQEHQNISLVILDYSMPVMDGKAAFEELLKINKDVKVLLCSGYNEEETLSSFGIKRPTGFFQKPYKIEALVERVSKILLD
jgi:two-component system cell cycle sensor histidine kinase/response regulator CckA